MVFSSISFLFYFLPSFLTAYFLFPFKNLTVFIFSIIFYAWGEPRFLPILLLYILVNYGIGRAMAQPAEARRAWMIAGVVGNLGMLVTFKYLNFLSAQVGALVVLAGWRPLPPVHIALPLGISFITFQGLSYVIDVYRGTVAPQRSLLKFAMYKSMFPQLIAGPIVRYSEIAKDIDSRPVAIDDLMDGSRQFILGLGQKVLIANMLAVPADQIFALPLTDLASATAWVGIGCYTLQIFFDFAGYSNMAIGIGRVIGFHFPVNFVRPYGSESVTDFWRRWHMTLSRWFLDYVYIPLGGNRVSSLRTYFNLLAVFLLCGLWHGTNWTFLIWGAYHGAFLVIERLGLRRVLQGLWHPLRHLYLILVVMVGWVFFRCDTLKSAIGFLHAMIGLGSASTMTPPGRYLTSETLVALCAGALLATLPFSKALIAVENRLKKNPLASIIGYGVAHTALVVMLALCVVDIAGGAYNPFIYYRF